MPKSTPTCIVVKQKEHNNTLYNEDKFPTFLNSIIPEKEFKQTIHTFNEYLTTQRPHPGWLLGGFMCCICTLCIPLVIGIKKQMDFRKGFEELVKKESSRVRRFGIQIHRRSRTKSKSMKLPDGSEGRKVYERVWLEFVVSSEARSRVPVSAPSAKSKKKNKH